MILNGGIHTDELRRFAEVLASDPDLDADYGALLWEAELVSIQVLLDTEDPDEPAMPVAQFGPEVANVADDDDPRYEPQYEEERGQLDARGMLGMEEEEDLHADNFELTPRESDRIARMVTDENYVNTVRHTARIVHSLAREDLTADEAEPLERVVHSLVATVCAAGDLEGAIEMVDRAHLMRASDRDLETQVGELSFARFLDPNNLKKLFATLDSCEYVEARALGDLLTRLGPHAATDTGHWLVVTRHPEIVAQAMRLFGEEATKVLNPLYEQGTADTRDRISPALLEIGTPDALRPLAADLPTLPEPNRVQLLKSLGRSQDPALREAVVACLSDKSERVRRAAANVLKRIDAALVAATVQRMFEREVFHEREDEEVTEFFEILGAIGDRELADVLAATCRARGLRRAFMKPTPLQKLTLRALRRMRDPGAREIVDRLASKGPKVVREILDDPFDF